MNQETPLGKNELISQLLEQEGRVMLCVNATLAGVEVPRRFKSDDGLRLILNKRMPQPIVFGQQTIESELRFGGVPHFCIIPYHSLWGAFNPDSGRGYFWPDTMPERVRNSFSPMPPGAIPMPPEPTPHPDPTVTAPKPARTRRKRTPPQAEPPPVPTTLPELNELALVNPHRPHLRVIEGSATEEQRIDPLAKPRPRPHLRLVE